MVYTVSSVQIYYFYLTEVPYLPFFHFIKHICQ